MPKLFRLDDTNFPHPSDGKYYLGDSEYALHRRYLCLYRGNTSLIY